MTDVKYQRPLKFNKLLPYSHLIDGEANDIFTDIKLNLSIAVQRRELWPGGLFWTNQLTSYLKVYGFHFTKEDHIKLVKLLFELVTIPNLESPLLNSWSSLLIDLLRDKKLLSPEDIQFPWRSLYELLLRISNSKMKKLGAKTYGDNTIATVKKLISSVRCYYTTESTGEMLKEWRPLLCPFDTAMFDAMEYFSDFLPTLTYPEHYHLTHELWFNELINLWLESRNNNQIDEFCVKLFSQLSQDTLGHIDWSPYYSQIFTRILNSFELPMGSKEFQLPQTKKISDLTNGSKFATLIVYLLGGPNSCQSYLTKLMTSLESYYHPSNIGFHTKKLLKFLEQLTTSFILRLKKERYTKPSWIPVPPKEYHLTEDDIDSFVQPLLPILWLSIFNKLSAVEASISVQNLALLRPALIFPPLMEKTYAALETLTEPHQVVSTLTCVTAASRTLLSSSDYPEGRPHLFMLLRLATPGIDTNDFRKMLVSSILISSLVTLVPLVDCSTAIGQVEMNEADVDLCSMTSQFEEFIDCLLERCFMGIESAGINHGASELGHVASEMKQDKHETLLGAGIAGLVYSVIGHSSPQLFQIVLEKLFRFASSHVFQSDIAGKMCAEMCGAAAKTNPHSTFNKFLPHCISTIENILEDPDQLDPVKPDVELIFNLQLLSCIVDTNGDSLLAHADVLLNCLKKCLQIKNKQAAKHTAKFVQSILTNLTQTYPTENRLTSHPLDLDPSEHLYINDWAYCCDIKDTNINWHVPSAAEYKLVDRILYEILQPQLDKLKRFIQDTTTMDRDSLLVCLELIQAIIQGTSAYLPNITGPLVDGCPRSSVSLERKFYMTSEVTQQPPLEFSRQTLLEFFHELKVCLMDKCEDDTKSLIALTGILKHLLINFGSDHKEIDLKWQSFKQSKIAMGNRLNKNKKLIRPMIVSRAYLQHELRILKCNMSTLTSLHLKIIEDLVDLSISSYSQVRSSAQQVVQIALDIYLFGARKILPKIIPSLKSSPEISHEKFKGSLYLLLSPALISAIVHDWQIMRSIVPLLAQADHSEKPTILNLISHIHNSIQKSYDGFSLKFEVSNTCLPLAAALNSPLSIEELQRGKDQLEEFNKKSIEMYNGLVEDLVAITEGQQGVTQWRFTEISVKLLAMLIRHDHPFPVKGLQMFVNYLNHDALNIRKVAIHAVTLLLQQLKRPLKKVPIDVAKLAGTTDVIDVAPGERKDNKWLCLDEDAIESEEVWNSNLGIVNKTRYGYYCYPVVLEGYAPISEQPKLDRTAAEMSQSEQIIFSSFTDQAFVEKLISFLSLEEIKGKDKYNSKRAQMFKNLFRNYGNTVTPCFRPHLEKLAIDSHESSQRCACEIIAGLVRSTNHWSYKMVMDLRGWLEPLIQKVLGTIQVETVDDWVQCFSDISADRDPKRINWLLQLLMKNSLSDESNGSFVESCHLSLLYLSLAQQEWRVPSLLQRLSSHLPAKLDHPFKNVREKLGMVIAGMYLVDARSMGYQMIYNPQLGDFLKMFQDKIPNPYQILHLSLESTELKICKTAMYAVISSYQPSSIEYYQLLGLLIPLAAYEGDEEISFLIKAVCVHLSRREICPNAIPEILELMTNVVTSLMWKAKLTVLLVIQVLVFWNFFNFVAVEKQLVNLLLHLMQDVQVEVRELASSTISGFVRCGFLSIEHLKLQFKEQSKIKLSKRNAQEMVDGVIHSGNEDPLIRRHCGVLGLAALVQSCPYSVPDWLPEIIDSLSTHLHDPAPIPSTVKKALSEFKRTHYDNWREHKLKFTEDQLSTLSDLLLSPSYYV